jgi:hypothetical protein
MTEQGLSLLDIGPASEPVQVGIRNGQPIFLEVGGVSAKGVFIVFKRFPEMMNWFKGGKVDIKNLVTEAPDAIAAIIAAACGEPGNEKAEAKAAKLSMEAQLDILEAIGRQTFALKGFGPFVLRIVALAEQAQSNNFGRAPATKSQPTSKPSLPPDTIQPQSGT